MSFKIILADDHAVVLNGTSSILKSSFENLEIREAQDFYGVIETLGKFDAQIILLDINISGGNSTGMIEKIRNVNPKIGILMFSAYEESHYAMRYIDAGANGFLSKDASEKQLIEAIHTLLATGSYISDAIKEKILGNILKKIPMNPLEVLSGREMEIANLLIKGNGNLEIANLLNIQTSTVSTYKNRIFIKLKISNIAGLIEIFRIYRA